MKKCIRCGKDVDIISRDPEKVFYCRACSLIVMNLTEEDLEPKEEVILEESSFFLVISKVIKSIIPGTHQLLNKEFLKGLIYIFSSSIIPFTWLFLMLYSLIEKMNEKMKFGLSIIGFLILLNSFFIFIKNLMEIWNKEENN